MAPIMLLNTRNVSQRYSLVTAPAANAGVACRAVKINRILAKLLLIIENTNFVIPAEGEAGVLYSMLYACETAGLCRSQRALQGGIQASNMFTVVARIIKLRFKLIVEMDIITLKIFTALCTLTGF